jgi:thioredoxin-related protein
MLFLNRFLSISSAAAWALILACTLAATAVNTARAQTLPLVSDLAEAARQAREKQIPVMVAFTLSTCPHCAVARRDHLVPMRASAKWRDQVIMVELQLDGPQPLVDFAGNKTTARDFARGHAVRSVPTVIVFNAEGKPTHAPLVGLAAGDFYSLYLEQAAETGLIDMRFPKR